MKIFGYTITRRPFGRRVMPLLFLSWTLIAIYQSISATYFFAPYRYGNSIIPSEEKLIKKGPFEMQISSKRAFYSVKFLSTNVDEVYVLDSSRFRDRIDIKEISNHNEGKLVAYLWVYPENPLFKVWKIEVGQQNIISYEEAQQSYRTISKTATWAVYSAALSFVLLIWSLISIKRSN